VNSRKVRYEIKQNPSSNRQYGMNAFVVSSYILHLIDTCASTQMKSSSQIRTDEQYIVFSTHEKINSILLMVFQEDNAFEISLDAATQCDGVSLQ
jgi:hypothetical protein